jgi:hypothetical protein
MIEFAYCILKIVTACTFFFGAGLLIVFFISSDISNLPGESNMTENSEQKIEQFWRDATAGDVAKVMRGEKVEARFRDYEHRGWWSSVLNGWRGERDRSWLDKDGAGWNHCQVYKPQQWWLDKPDPGEGWRLLGKFPDEPKLWTDEAWGCHSKEWRQTSVDDGIQSEEVWYRRRIEPVKQDAGSTCASNIPKGWAALSDDEPRLASDAYCWQGGKDWIIIGDNHVEYANRNKWPAIRQIETQKTMQLVLWCQYRLPNGRLIKVTKEGFELL